MSYLNALVHSKLTILLRQLHLQKMATHSKDGKRGYCLLTNESYNPSTTSNLTTISTPSHLCPCEHKPAGEGGTSITILHFNDVYNVEGRDKEPKGGAARFKTALEEHRHLHPLVLFSGDALSPSTISVVMKGEQMVPVLNSLGVKCAVYGNHEFDFGVDHLVNLVGKMNFPWLMSNVHCKDTNRPLANGLETHIIDWQGKKIGLIGLVEKEWLVTLGTVEVKELIYTDFVEAAQRLIPQLLKKGCDLLVALTHMRVPNDKRLAREVPELHMILGGHDHHYEMHTVGNVLMLKSGSEFREFSQITVTFPNNERGPSCLPVIEVVRHEVTGRIVPDPELNKVVMQCLDKVNDGLDEVIGEIDVNLEGRFRQVRTKETNMGNLVTDVMRQSVKADIALLNSGTLRSDTIHEAGIFKMKDLISMLPIMDSIILLQLSGEQLLTALENGVSQYPKHDGRFPQLSGLSFTFDPSQPSGSRILPEQVLVAGEPLEEGRSYTLCTRGYLGQRGKDGYDVFKKCKLLIPEDEGPILCSIMREYIERCYAHSSSSSSPESAENSGRRRKDRIRISPHVEGRIISNPLLESSGSE